MALSSWMRTAKPSEFCPKTKFSYKREKIPSLFFRIEARSQFHIGHINRVVDQTQDKLVNAKGIT